MKCEDSGMTEVIKVDHLNYQYEAQKELNEMALKDVSFTINKGEWVAIIGHNGSGKSTLSKNINGLLAPKSGEITVDGLVLSTETVWDIRRKIGIVFQNPDNQFVGATVEDDVAFGLENNGIERKEMQERVKDALERVDMWQFAAKEPARLSGGQKQRVAIAGIVALRPEVIILDESTSMLDPEGRDEVLSLIHQLKDERGLTIISITHDINEAASADKIMVMDGGQLVKQGTPAEIFALGEQLVDMGLDVPYPERLKAALKKRYFDIPDDYMTEEGMVDWLWQLNSTK